MPHFRHVLIASDFSECSNAATNVALDLAKRYEARLTLIHVCEIPAYAYEMGPMTIDFLTPLHEAAQQSLQSSLDSLRKRFADAQALLKNGVAWQQILAAAKELNADLIVMGTHGRRGFAHALMGSVAEKVVRLSTIPVLTVRGHEPQPQQDGSNKA